MSRRPLPTALKDAVLDAWAHGTVSSRRIATALQISQKSVGNIVFRARQAGDPRAILIDPAEQRRRMIGSKAPA